MTYGREEPIGGQAKSELLWLCCVEKRDWNRMDWEGESMSRLSVESGSTTT